MIETALAAYIVIGIGWALTMRDTSERAPDMPSEIRVFDFCAGVLAWPAEAACLAWCYAAGVGEDGPDRPA